MLPSPALPFGMEDEQDTASSPHAVNAAIFRCALAFLHLVTK